MADDPSQWSAIQSIASKIGCRVQTLRRWVRREERHAGRRSGPTGEQSARPNALEREKRALRQASDILRKASAYFTQAALDRRFKP